MSEDQQSRSELVRELKMFRHYAYGYGNAEGLCEYGYPQHPGYICGLCQHDNSHGDPCPKASAEK